MQCNSQYVEKSVSRETLIQLQSYVDLLIFWTARINLISKSTVSSIWHRHIADSAQLYGFLPQDSAHIVDVGTGGGLPGVVLAILSRDSEPTRRFTFIESDARKSVFLRRCVQSLDLKATVKTVRVEKMSPLAADVVTARGFASLDTLMGVCEQHLNPMGVGLFPKGQSFASEISTAKATWDFHLEALPSISDPEARLLLIKDINRAE